MPNKKKVLLLSPFFFPEQISTGKYNTTLAEQLVATGNCDVVVICSHPLYPEWVPKRTKQDHPRVSTLRGGSWLRYPRRAVMRRALLELWFATHIFCSVLKLRLTGFRPDLAIAVLPPGLFLFFLQSLLPSRGVIVGIVHDIQGILASEDKHGESPSKLTNQLIRWLEGAGYRSCTELVFLSKGMMKWATENYRVDPLYCSVHYPFSTPLPHPTEEEKSEVCRILAGRQRRIVYSGALGEKQAPTKLVCLLRELTSRHPEWSAHIFSSGPIFESLRAENADAINFHPLVDQRLLPALLALSDMQLVPQETGTSAGAFPSKLPYLMMSSCRVLAITDSGSEVAQMMQSYPRGLAISTWDFSSFEDAFRDLAALPSMEPQDDCCSQDERFSPQPLVEKLLECVAIERQQDE